MKPAPFPFQDCTICMERLVMSSGYEGILQHKGLKPELVGKLGKCGHMYHLLCLVAMYNNGNKVGESWRPDAVVMSLSAQSRLAMSCRALADDQASATPNTDGNLRGLMK